MKTILVTGSNGLLGQTLTSLLISKKGVNLIATSKGENRHALKEGYEYKEMDLCDEASVTDIVANTRPDVIINTAAMTNVDTCHAEREKCLAINVSAVETLAKLCESLNIHLIHLSTDFVFDGLAGPYSEEDQPNPLSFYGDSKYEAEKIVQRSSCKSTIIRTILVYGITANMSRSNIVLWAKEALKKSEKIKVVNDQWRMPTLVHDLAEACWLVADKGSEGLYHISGRDMMTVFELVNRVAEFWKLDKSLVEPVSSATLNQEAKRPMKTGFILDKAMNELGYRPVTFSEGLKIVQEALDK